MEGLGPELRYGALNGPQICARCRHWTPIYDLPVEANENPGECHGQIGKWSWLNGMWMKAIDSCEQWQLSPERARLSRSTERRTSIC